MGDMRHVYQMQMRATAPKGKSIFKTNVKAEVRDLVEATINYPDAQRNVFTAGGF